MGTISEPLEKNSSSSKALFHQIQVFGVCIMWNLICIGDDANGRCVARAGIGSLSARNSETKKNWLVKASQVCRFAATILATQTKGNGIVQAVLESANIFAKRGRNMEAVILVTEEATSECLWQLADSTCDRVISMFEEYLQSNSSVKLKWEELLREKEAESEMYTARSSQETNESLDEYDFLLAFEDWTLSKILTSR